MNKNLIFIHLESLNSSMLVRSGIFPNIRKLMNASIVFENYYTTATSTYMSVTDLLYGDMNACENSSDLSSFCICDSCKSIFEESPLDGYKKMVFVYPKRFLNEQDFFIQDQIFGQYATLEFFDDYRSFTEAIDDAFKSESPKLIYIYDITSIFGCDTRKNDPAMTWNENQIEGYHCIDETVGVILDCLNKYDEMEKSIIVAFGDHGDDLFSYGLENGFTHAIEPYPSIIKTPMIIYYGKHKGINESLICTIDIKDIVLSLLHSGELEIVNRKFVCSRNLFRKQKSRVINKSYSLTDGNYLLLLSSRGYRLYSCVFPSYSHVNLLVFFVTRGRKLSVKPLVKRVGYGHIVPALYKQFDDVEKTFVELRINLDLVMKENNYFIPNRARNKIDRQRSINWDILRSIKIKSIEKLEGIFGCK